MGRGNVGDHEDELASEFILGEARRIARERFGGVEIVSASQLMVGAGRRVLLIVRIPEHFRRQHDGVRGVLEGLSAIQGVERVVEEIPSRPPTRNRSVDEKP